MRKAIQGKLKGFKPGQFKKAVEEKPEIMEEEKPDEDASVDEEEAEENSEETTE